jgi:SAM-dependent methyltransferase
MISDRRFAESIVLEDKRVVLNQDVRTPRPVQKHPKPSVRTVIANVDLFRSQLPLSARVLIIGGGVVGHGTSYLFSDPDVEVVSFDVYPSASTQFVADGHHIPLAESSFDGVFIQAVLEHVLSPSGIVSEILRVLKPKGVVYSETAFMQQVHEGAHDYTRFSERGHRWLFREFEEIYAGPIGGPALQFVWSIDYLVRGLTRSRRTGLLVRKVVSILERLDGLVPLEHCVDSAPAVFFLGRKSTDSDMNISKLLQGYKGPAVEQ